MTILPNSDIKGASNLIYLNNEEIKDGKSGTKLFFTDASSQMSYFLMKDFIVIASGLMRGYRAYPGGPFNYRFDFQDFIQIYNQNIIPHTMLDSQGSYYFEGELTCELHFFMSTGNSCMQDNISASRLIRNPDGTVVMHNTEFEYTDLIYTTYIKTKFIDAAFTDYDQSGDELQYRVGTNLTAPRGKYMPVTIYNNNKFYYVFEGVNRTLIYQSPVLQKNPIVDLEAAYSFRVYMLRIPDNCVNVEFYVYSQDGYTVVYGGGENLLDGSAAMKFEPKTVATNASTLITNEAEHFYRATSAGLVHIIGGTRAVIIGKPYSSSMWVRTDATTTVSIYRQGNTSSRNDFQLIANQWTYIYSKPGIATADIDFEISLSKPGARLDYKKAKTERNEATMWSPSRFDTSTNAIYAYGVRTSDTCVTPYYFWNVNGAYDVIYCTGVINKVESVDKKYITVSGTKYPLKMIVSSGVKQNTGLILRQEQIYSLIKAPQVDAITLGPVHNLMNIDLSSFEGFNGINLSSRNMELIFMKPTVTKRITNKNITFFD